MVGRVKDYVHSLLKKQKYINMPFSEKAEQMIKGLQFVLCLRIGSKHILNDVDSQRIVLNTSVHIDRKVTYKQNNKKYFILTVKDAHVTHGKINYMSTKSYRDYQN